MENIDRGAIEECLPLDVIELPSEPMSAESPTEGLLFICVEEAIGLEL